MSIDKDVFYITLAILAALASSIAAFTSGRHRTINDADGCDQVKAEFSAFEKYIAGLMFGQGVSREDIAVILYNLTGMSVEDVTTSQAKTTQAIEAIQEFKRRGILLQVLPALYKQCPHLLK